MLAVPELRESLLEGVEKVDSFNMNLSKCGVGGFDSSPMWIKNRFFFKFDFLSIK